MSCSECISAPISASFRQKNDVPTYNERGSCFEAALEEANEFRAIWMLLVRRSADRDEEDEIGSVSAGPMKMECFEFSARQTPVDVQGGANRLLAKFGHFKYFWSIFAAAMRP